MIYKAEQKVSNYIFTDTKITKEQLTKECIHKLVEDIPLDELKKVFNVEILEPTEEAMNKADLERDHITFDKLFRLKQQELTSFEVNIEI